LQAVRQRGYTLLLSIILKKLFPVGLIFVGCRLHILLLLSHLLFLFLRQVLLEALHCLGEFLLAQSRRLFVQDIEDALSQRGLIELNLQTKKRPADICADRITELILFVF
jgi:hypothetical protein